MSRALNFTKAAEECHVSQPALTRAIRKMEDELGGLLFCREPNNTHMTALGRLIEPHLTEIVAHCRRGKRTATRFLKLECARLALGIMCTVAPVQFVRLFGPFRADNSGSRLRCWRACRSSSAICWQWASWTWRRWLVRTAFPAPLHAWKLYSERFVIACSVGHRFAVENEIRLADLDGEFYLSRISCEFPDILERFVPRIWPREIVPKRARGLDPDDGCRWDGDLHSARIYSHFPGCRRLPGNIALGRAQCLPGHRRRPSLVTASYGISASGAAPSLAVGIGHPKSARN